MEERNGPIIFIFSLSRHFPTYFGLKGSHNGIFFNFLNFLDILLEFSITRRVGPFIQHTTILIFTIYVGNYKVEVQVKALTQFSVSHLFTHTQHIILAIKCLYINHFFQ